MRASAILALLALLGGCSGGAAPLPLPDAGADAGGPDSDADADADTDADAGTDAGADPGAPLYAEVGVYETTIAASGDPADVYYPEPGPEGEGLRFPVALLLQGADVGRAHYAGFAAAVAAYGFIVVVPDHQSLGFAGVGLYAEQSEAADALAHLAAEGEDPGSPVAGAVDAETLVLLGHSYGGLCGLNIVRGVCEPPTCVGLAYDPPAALAGAALYGTNAALPFVGTLITHIDNGGRPLALVQGTVDGKALPEDTQEAFTMVQDPPKAYVGVIGANHYGICDVDDPPGAQADPSAPELAQAVAVETIARWSALFLRAYALGDAAARDYVAVTGGPADPNANVVLEE